MTAMSGQAMLSFAICPIGQSLAARSSVRVEDFLHPAPKLLRAMGRNRELAGVGLFPPFLGCRISSHLGHVGLAIVPRVLEIREEVGLSGIDLLEVDRVVPDVA